MLLHVIILPYAHIISTLIIIGPNENHRLKRKKRCLFHLKKSCRTMQRIEFYFLHPDERSQKIKLQCIIALHVVIICICVILVAVSSVCNMIKSWNDVFDVSALLKRKKKN